MQRNEYGRRHYSTSGPLLQSRSMLGHHGDGLSSFCSRYHSTVSSSSEDDEEGRQREHRFVDLENLHPSSLRALTGDMGLSTMTEIQHTTFDAASRGRDVLGRARTGTGKTLAFLLPTVETLLRDDNDDALAIVISPTRELATQIGDQAQALVRHHRQNLHGVQIMFGGTKKHVDTKRFRRRLPSILVATPGRLLDHLRTDPTFARALRAHARVLVLDETDRLLDMGFRTDVEEIISFLPPPGPQRQTLLFSATMPRDLRKLMANTMAPDFLTADCIGEHDDGVTTEHHTNEQVDQFHVVLPSMDRYVSGVVETVFRAVRDDETRHKIIVFFPTAMLVRYFAYLFNREMRFPVLELHSKKSQDVRTKTSKKFRNLKKGVLLTTDVSARGVDYPDVTHVIQFGMADNRETYIHRLGRTGRAGKKGKGWLVLAPFEVPFLQELGDLDVPVEPSLTHMFDEPLDPIVERVLTPVLEKSRNSEVNPSSSSSTEGPAQNLSENARKAYQTMLSFYASKLSKFDSRELSKADLVTHANTFSFHAGLRQPPTLSASIVQKLGFRGVPGLTSGGDDRRGGKRQFEGHSNYHNNRRGGDNRNHHNRGRPSRSNSPYRKNTYEKGGGFGGGGRHDRQQDDDSNSWWRS